MSSAMRALSNVDAGIVKAEIEIAATPTRVFHSLTDANELAAWWGSDDMYRTSLGRSHRMSWNLHSLRPLRPLR